MKKTDQEIFWQGEFGDEYVDRNQGDLLLSSNIYLFSKVFKSVRQVSSVIEFGCNIGMNLKAIKQLLPNSILSGIEINNKAINELKKWSKDVSVKRGSILDIELNLKFDLTLIKGVLIHINPKRLDDVYTRLYEFSNKYICIVEYYNPTPVSIPYREHNDRLFKRDFAGEIMNKYPDLKLVDYGFVYHNDSNFPQDDLTWFLLEK